MTVTHGAAVGVAPRTGATRGAAPRSAAGPAGPWMTPRPRPGRVWLAVGSYLIWGMLPLLYASLGAAGAVEILAHRVLWGMVLCLVLTIASGQGRDLRALLRRPAALAATAGAAALLALNWSTHVVGILTGQVVDAGIGYLLNPLLTVLLGVLVLRQRLVRGQWVAVAVAGVAVLVIAGGYRSIPWVALLLPVSWAVYGLLKQRLPVRAPVLAAFTAELLVLTPFAAVVLVRASADGTATFVGEGAVHTALLVSTGVFTAVPLLMFNAAARHVPLPTLGMVQYVSAICQAALGVAYFHEPMPPARWAGLILVLVAVAIFASSTRSVSIGPSGTPQPSGTPPGGTP